MSGTLDDRVITLLRAVNRHPGMPSGKSVGVWYPGTHGLYRTTFDGMVLHDSHTLAEAYMYLKGMLAGLNLAGVNEEEVKE